MYYPPKLLLLFTALFFYQNQPNAQGKLPIKFGKISPDDFKISSPLVDANANAITIADIGSSEFIGNDAAWFSYVFRKHRRVKIINKNALDIGTVVIDIHGGLYDRDIIDSIMAVTYNLVDGKVVESKLDAKDIFEEKAHGMVTMKKFTFPNVKEGSIIEYSYKKTSDRYYALPIWNFQDLRYPCLFSSYSIEIPDMLNYRIFSQGADTFSWYKKETTEDRNYVSKYYSVHCKANKFNWVMENIPGFKKEDHLYAPEDYLDKIEFALIQTYNGSSMSNHATDWKQAAEWLSKHRYFGVPIDVENSANLFNTMEKVAGKDDNLKEAASHLYSYVRDNFTAEKDDDITINKDLWTVNKLKNGNVAEINLLLIALLRQKGIDANPVILSTREYGLNSSQYPILEKMNYVICMIKYYNDTILLDASQKLLGFGKLPIECFNGHSRIIYPHRADSLYLMPEHIKEEESVSAIVTNDENGGVSGRVSDNMGYYQSFDVRRNIQKNSFEKYKTNLSKKFLDGVIIQNLTLDSLNAYDLPIAEHFDLAMPAIWKEDEVYFNPMLGTEISENPFKAENRSYPIEMPYRKDFVYTLDMEIPKGYRVEELPKSIRANLNKDEGKFEYLISVDEGHILIRARLFVNETSFVKEDYEALRNFYSMVIKKEAEQIVFKVNK